MFIKQMVKLRVWYMHLPMSQKLILTSFLFWFAQAVPKWGFVLFGDGEVAASLMTSVITPDSECVIQTKDIC